MLVVLQGMDAAGKDSVIKHVMSGINPQGCEVHGFKAPSERGTAARFFLARTTRACRRAAASAFSIVPITKKCWWCGCIPSLLTRRTAAVAAPTARISGSTASRKSARSSSYLVAQRDAGAEIPSAHLQGGAAQALPGATRRTGQALEVLHRRHRRTRHWDEYMEAFEDMIRSTSTPEAPWYVVPADHKHVAWLVRRRRRSSRRWKHSRSTSRGSRQGAGAPEDCGAPVEGGAVALIKARRN